MTPQELVKGVEQMISLPDVFIRVNEMIDSHRYSAVDIAQVISQDTNLTARLLQIVNSAFYGLPGRVDTVSRAITIIGTSDLRNLAITTATAEVFTGIPADLVDMEKYWRYAVSTGVIAKELATRCHVLHAERLFVMGVMHDVGRLVIYQVLPEAARDVLLITKGDDALVLEAEKDIMGFTHQEVGYELFKLWKMPESLKTIVRYHHNPSQCSEFSLEAGLVHLASKLAIGLINNEELEDSILDIDHEVWMTTGLIENEIYDVMQEVPGLINEMVSLVYPHSPAASRPGM